VCFGGIKYREASVFFVGYNYIMAIQKKTVLLVVYYLNLNAMGNLRNAKVRKGILRNDVRNAL